MYRIKDWDGVFENHKTRILKTMERIQIPADLASNGYTLIMENPDGPAIYGCFIAVCILASKCTPRGELRSKDGSPLNIQAVSRRTRISINKLSTCLDFCENTCKWLIPLEGGATRRISAGNRTTERRGEERRGQERSIYLAGAGEKNTAQQIYDFWISRESLIQHKRMTPQMRKRITECMKEYSSEELVSSIRNYANILKHPKLYFYQYSHPLDEFFRAGVQKTPPYRHFLDEAKPHNNYLRDKSPATDIKDTPEARQGFYASIKVAGGKLEAAEILTAQQALELVNRDFNKNYTSWVDIKQKAPAKELKNILILLEQYLPPTKEVSNG